jgi:hypothetical protein
MKNKVISIAAGMILIFSACAPQATPTANPVDVQKTAAAAAYTMVAQTQAAVPTSTPIPTDTATPLPTLTPVASLTLTSDPFAVNTPTGIPTLVLQQPTTPSSSGTTTDTCNKTLTEWDGPTVTFSIVNETRPQGTIVVSLYVVTPLGECGYLADLSQGPAGTYSVGAFVDGRQSFKVFGGFTAQAGNWDIIIRNDRIIAQGSCYPNC